MATIPAVVTTVGDTGDGSVLQIVWTPVTESDSCAAVQFPRHADKSIQAAGTFGSASVAVQGSNDGTNFAALHDTGGTAIGITTAGIKQVLENTLQVKPVISGGSSQNLTISMLFHLSNPLRT